MSTRLVLPYTIPVSTCPECRKQSYQSRRDARKAAKSLHPGQRMRTYRCSSRWHFTSESALRTAAWKDYRSEAQVMGNAAVLAVASHHARLANPAVGWAMLAGFALAGIWAFHGRRGDDR